MRTPSYADLIAAQKPDPVLEAQEAAAPPVSTRAAVKQQRAAKSLESMALTPAAKKLMASVALPGMSVPEGGEAMTPRDIEQLIPRVIDEVHPKLPSKLPVSRSQIEPALNFLMAKDARHHATFDHEGGHDYLVVYRKFTQYPTRIRLADEPKGPDRHSPVSRIAAIGRHAPPHKPLLGLRVSIDPGHFGGVEDLREGKFVTRGPTPKDPETVPADGLTEGDLNAISARNLARRLSALGAEVTITRQGSVARTKNRAYVEARLDADPELSRKVGENRKGFLTSLDLERRAQRMAAIHPDINIVMHFDAEVNQVSEKARKEVKIYVPGCFSKDSIASNLGHSRFLRQCASHSWTASADLAKTLVQSICKATGAIPQTPGNTGAVPPEFLIPVGDDSGVFARSLRLPHAAPGEPLQVYLEGATYNHPDIFEEVFKDKGSAYGKPGGFLDNYAKSIADGLVEFVHRRA